MRGEDVGKLDGAVAIVGVGCVFPLARDAATFWSNVLAGRDCIRELPLDRFDASLFYDPDPRAPDRSYCRVAGYVDEIPVDPRQLRIPPLVWRSMDRFQRLGLAAAVEAFADAGLDRRPFDHDRAGVFLGQAGGRSDSETATNWRVQHPVVERAVTRCLENAGVGGEDVDRVLADLRSSLIDPLPPITEDTMSGSLPNVTAGRIASHFDLRGMSCVLDSACASTLAALQRAQDALRLGEVDLAFVGGFHAVVGPAVQIAFSKFQGLSRERVRPFDARADGFVIGEGAGIFVVKRLADAVRDDDRVYVVVRGVGCSSDGREKGIGAPNPRSQALAMQRAYDDAGIDPGTVQYVETHGAGTAVGDPAEIDAMRTVFGPSRMPGRMIMLGAIKSHVGHLMGAAGAAGLMATILGLHHRVMPQALNHEVGNPAIPWEETPFQVVTTPQPWPNNGTLPPRAGVSAFGFGGTNFHAVLERYEPSFHGDATWAHPGTREPVAVIGLAAVLPCGEGPEAVWESIAGLRSAVVELPPERLEGQPELFRSVDPDAPDRTRGTIGATVETPVPSAGEFRLPPSVLAHLDPEQHLIMACGSAALRDAGLTESGLDHARTAVVLGEAAGCQHTVWNNHMRLNAPRVERALCESAPLRALLPGEVERATLAAAVHDVLLEGSVASTEETVLANCAQIGVARLMKAFDLKGLQLLVDAACASSLGAVGAAVDALRTRRADVVLTGGVAATITPTTLATFSKAGGLSPTGSRPFAADADGATFGEGAAMVVLKRLGDAIRDGDRISAVVRGVGASSDGHGRGMTAPDAEGQALAIHRACEEAGCEASSVQLVECHATATPVGDATELEAMRLAYGDGRRLRIGSIKSQIGHLAGGAGAAGLLKVILALQRRTLPPTLLTGAPRQGLAEGNGGGFVPVHEPEPWPENEDGEPRRAGVSAFGFGGTNYHVVVEEYVPAYHMRSAEPPDGGTEGTAWPDQPIEPVLVAVGGPSLADALHGAHDVAAATVDGASLIEEARALRRSATASPAHAATVGQDAALGEKRELAWREPPGGVAVLFPGQGCHYPDMLRGLHERYELVRATFREADAALVGLVPAPIEQLVFTGDGRDASDVEALLLCSEVVQPVIVTANVAVFRLLAAAGLEPDVATGHSLGEYAALVAAGVLTLGDAVRVAHARGAAMARLAQGNGAGAMAAIAAPAEAVEPVLRAVSGLVVVANRNSPSQTVVAGTAAAVTEALNVLAERYLSGRLLPIAGAFHSELARPARAELVEALAAVEARQGALPVLSSVDGEYLLRGEAAGERVRALLAEQLTAPVDFVALVERLYADGVRTFVEVGPRRTLVSFIDEILAASPHVALPTDDHRVPAAERLPRAFARLLAAGVPVEPERLDNPETTGSEGSSPAPRRLLARPPRPNARSGDNPDEEPLVVSGLAVGLPGKAFHVFSDEGIERLLAGQSLIDALGADEQDRIVEKRIVRVVKPRDGDPRLEEVRDRGDAVKLAGQRGSFDLADWGIVDERVGRADPAFQLAVAAGFEGLRDAGIPLQRLTRRQSAGRGIPGGLMLPESLQRDTAVLYATAYPAYHVLLGEVSAFFADRYGSLAADGLRGRYLERIQDATTPQEKAEADAWFAAEQIRLFDGGTADYRFNTDLISAILCSGNTLFAQLVQARGPNVQLNASCASTMVALAAAEDMIRSGRAERAVVLAADDVTSGPVLEWIAAGFLAAGAAATDAAVEEAALPFDARRHGMLLGMGAVCLVIERADAVRERGMEPIAELLGVRYANCAGHPTRPDGTLAGELMSSLLDDVEHRYGLDRGELSEQLLYMSHETYTPARNGIAQAEVQMLREAFGEAWTQVTVANLKGLTGHPQGAGLEDAVALRALQLGRLPTLPAHVQPDPALAGLRLSRGGPTDLRYALRYSAGFGGHAAVSLSRIVARGLGRTLEPDRYARWLETVTGIPGARAEVVGRTLGVREPSVHPPAQPSPDLPAPSTPSPPAPLPPVSEPEPEPVPVPLVPVVPVSAGSVAEAVLAVVEERTGYERELLELDLDLEADLGIDTIKQAQILADLAERFGIALEQEELALAELPTLRHVIERLELQVAAGAPQTATPQPEPQPEPEPPVVPVSAGSVAEAVLAVVEERTGYERELLELDLDLEADLGIDTIKQAQILADLAERFGIALEQEELALAELPTLRHVIERLELQVAAGAPQTATPQPEPQPEPEPPVVPVSAGSVAEAVLAVVEERTGYERELLELDLDLEADLGIDTIKQAQILADLAERFGIALEQEELALAELPTLRHVIERLELQVAAGAPETETPKPESESSGRILRYAVVSTPAPLGLGQSELRIGEDWNVLVVDGDPVDAAAVCQAFASHGAWAVPVSLPAAPADAGPASTRVYHEAVQAAVREARDGLDRVHGVVFLSDLPNALDPAALPAAVLRAELRRRVQGPFAVLQGLHADLEQAAGERHAFVLASGSSGCPAAGALSGLLKTVARELSGLVVKAVSSPGGAVAPELLLAELERGGGHPEVTYSDGERRVLQLVPAALDRTAPRFDLGPESVVLLVGGGRGITAAIARELAADRPTLELWGTTPLPADVTQLAGLDPAGLAALRRELSRRRRTRDPSAPPVVLDEDYRTALRAIEIQRTIDDLVQAGATVRYTVVDVCDEDGVRRGIDALFAEHGRLDAIVFGAGTIEDKLLADKDPVSFERVLHVKAVGLGILLAALRGREPSVLAGMSSIVGRLGNRGQADYAAANAFLATTLAADGAGRRIAIDWTAWDEVGLAARSGAAGLLRDAGLGVLTPAEGARLCRDELVFGEPGEVVISGDLGARAAGPAPVRGFDGVLAHEPGARLVATRTFTSERDAWLDDHVVAGSPWLPAVAGIEMMARAAAVLAPGLRVAEIENLEIPLAVKVVRGRSATVRVTAEAEHAVGNGERRVAVRIESDVVHPDGAVLRRDRLHYRATVVCSARAAEPPPAPQAPGNGPVPAAILYGPDGLLPHGPAFQPVERLASFRDEGASGVVTAGSAHQTVPGMSTEPSLTAPLAREAALQVSGVWALLHRGVLALPSGCRRIELFGPVPAGVRLSAEALVRRVDGDELEFDLVLAGDDGRVYDRMSGYRAVRVGRGPGPGP